MFSSEELKKARKLYINFIFINTRTLMDDDILNLVALEDDGLELTVIPGDQVDALQSKVDLVTDPVTAVRIGKRARLSIPRQPKQQYKPKNNSSLVIYCMNKRF